MKDTIENEDDETLEFKENAKFTRVYDYLPYSHWRIKQILNNYYNAHLVCIRGYKEGRYAGYKQHYNIYANGTNRLISEHVYLYDLRCIFARNGFPLHEPDINRNPSAENFLNIITELSEKQ